MPVPKTNGTKYLSPYNYSHKNLLDWQVYLALLILGLVVFLIIIGKRNNNPKNKK